MNNDGLEVGEHYIKSISKLKFVSSGNHCASQVITGYGEWLNGDRYEGEWIGKKPHGNGILKYPSGDMFYGRFNNGKMCGRGTYTKTDGTIYVGEFKQGKREGKGTYTKPNGYKYVGQFKNGKQDGMAECHYPSGDRYVGEFKNGKREGEGHYIKLNGDEHIGDFRNGDMPQKIRENNSRLDKFNKMDKDYESLLVDTDDELLLSCKRPNCNTCGDSDDIIDNGGSYYWCDYCKHEVDDDGDCVTDPCSACDDEEYHNSNEIHIVQGEINPHLSDIRISSRQDELDFIEKHGAVIAKKTIYYDNNKQLDKCSNCGVYIAAMDCEYGECGNCCDGEGCMRHGR